MKRWFTVLVVVAVATIGLVVPAQASCLTTSYRGGMTAALVNPGYVTGEVDATGCDIGVYFDTPGVIEEADIHGSLWFGVVNNGTSVDIVDSDIHDIGDTPFSGAQRGVAVYFDATNGGTGTVSGNHIWEYQKGGVVINGSSSYAEVVGNTIEGLDVVPFIAQNGIQFGYGATGTAKFNSVDGNWYDGANWSSTGILLFEVDDVVVQGNLVAGNQVGIGVETWSYLVESASFNQIVKNTVMGSEWGITIAAYAWTYTTGDPVATGNKVVNNVVTSTSGDTGIAVYLWNPSLVYTASADGNKLISNSVTGFATAFGDDSGTAKVHANVIP